MAETPSSAGFLHRAFAASVWLKAFDGVLEMAGGLVLLLTGNRSLNRLVIALTQHELAEDPHDLLANALRHAAAQFSASAELFASIYLIAHGLIKLALAVALLRGKPWAYPAALGFLGLFILYQLYRLSYSYSLGLALLTAFDVLVVVLVWREYRAHRPE
ncbi:hypothetical protein SE17_37320 [Kouleothrix aurantiaca]|uniref:DUF2127 domain-containing protein n=1 Tax=Kouleothrix aurantiaca TaxID=186479 RepID=A0A0P9EW52_9CHLR|nr:hypothetical protein SE17_37320 [Kouleothrix aurantiaca]